ncbi:putative muramoyl-pentapeptide carboxypeptidase [Firmicutes bacterium CAG:110]|nr:putative muramoyl-pentapeptide carboxypeptidase [Firmicutes bacterium CAG:110]
MTVKQIQCLLTYLGYSPGTIDGIEGRNTQGAIRAFQADYGLTVDGIFGIGTEARIREVVASGEPPQQPQDTQGTEGGADWWKDIRYFKRAEFRCPCGRCGGFPVEPQESMVRTVDEIRHRLGVPISIVDGGGSGVRCAAHNAEVGGVSNSQHLFGLAADLHSAASPAEMKSVAEEVMGRTGGIGLYDWGARRTTRRLVVLPTPSICMGWRLICTAQQVRRR